jgi:radical SAM superfamily enzyme YgiQ (UPF0313 family)
MSSAGEGRVVRCFKRDDLGGCPSRRSALLINPPVYDTQYWAEWSQPYGLLRIATLLKKYRYKRVELFDFMETDEQGKVHDHRINPHEEYGEADEVGRPIQPIVIEKKGEALRVHKRHFGRTWDDFEGWLDRRGFTRKHPPNEIWISAIMTYWWESVRDLTKRLRRRFGKRTTILLGGIYPTLVPRHAARMTDADLVVVGELGEANDLPTDLCLYDKTPEYAIITPSRGCPFNCAYCAQRKLNGGRRRVRSREPQGVLNEMRDKYERYGIRKFAFYADYLLARHRESLMPILRGIVDEKLPFKLHVPEGFDTRTFAESQELVHLLKAAGLERVYLPLEHLDGAKLRKLNRTHVTLQHFVQAVQMCDKAGFRLRNLEVNAFVLYGLPKETVAEVVRTTLFVSHVVGSIIPMLFTPVPGTRVFDQYLSYFRRRGWHRDLHMLNGKLYPFLHLNEGGIEDYVDLQRLMYTLNAHYRSRSFSVFGSTRVAAAFRENVRNGFGKALLDATRTASSRGNSTPSVDESVGRSCLGVGLERTT